MIPKYEKRRASLPETMAVGDELAEKRSKQAARISVSASSPFLVNSRV
jgi:hypothetical protein